jgi:hypothetical protein
VDLVTTGALPDIAEIGRIGGIGNRVIRNLEITECYARLSAAVSQRMGLRAANWCTFATWASRQAGRTIRGEDLVDLLKRHLGREARLLRPFRSIGRVLLRKGLFEPDTRLGAAVAAIHTPFDSLERASDAVARGNLKVFAEIGAEFARYLATVPAGAQAESSEMARFLDGLQPGPPPDGQDYLKEAFTHYQSSAHAGNDRTQTELILLANLKIGLHEQTRLQPQIVEAVDAPAVTAVDLGRRPLHALWPASRQWPGAVHGPIAVVLGWMAHGVRRAGRRAVREVVTESMMTLALPENVISLGRDLEVPVPSVLAEPRLPDLVVFLSAHDPCPPGGFACGAADWCDLGQRMHYILHLFRAHAVDESLFTPPFTPAQVEQFRAGRIPEGPL